MQILVDENIPLMSVRFLKESGHGVIDIRGTEYEGADDANLWMLAQSNEALLITTDKGFQQRRFEKHHGILIVRLRRPNRTRIHQRVIDMVTRFNQEEWKGMLVVAQDTVHRVSYSRRKA